MTPEDTKEERRRRRILARFRFKCLIRSVIINQYWLSELEDTKLGDNVRRNIEIIVRRKGHKGLLSILEKRILNTPFEERTVDEREQLLKIFLNLKCFERFPPSVRARLSRAVQYMYFGRGRTIIKENHHASAMYFILDGEITVFRKRWDSKLKEIVNTPVGAMNPGEMFGEVALLYDMKRTATCQAATNCELLCLFREEFDQILKDILKRQWDQILMALDRFEYFKNWTDDQIRECCVLARIKQYNPQEIIYSEDTGVLSYVHFVLSGKCAILQCLQMNVISSKQGERKYTLTDISSSNGSKEIKRETQTLKKSASVDQINEVKDDENDLNNNEENENETDVKVPVKVRPSTAHHSDTKSKSMAIVDHRFIDVGTFSCGSVFALGECMPHRTILARNLVQCLLIPRYWLFHKTQNVGNVWYRTKQFLDASIPSREKLFVDFLATLNWNKYRKDAVRNVISNKINRNPTRLRDVPIICRIEENI